MKRLLVLFIAVAVSAMPVISSAEIREGSFEISPMIGLSVFDVKGDQTDSGFDNHSRRPTYTLGLGYNFTKHVGVEAMYNKIEDKADFYHADVLYHFTPERAFNPYFVAGVGYAHLRHISHDNSEGSLLGNFGLGFKYFFSRNVAFRVDVRDYITRMQNPMASVGFTIALGGKTPQPAPEPAPAPAPVPAPKPEPKPEPKPAPAPKPVPKPEPAPVKIILEDVHFDFDKATLTKEAKDILARDIKTLKSNPSVKVQVEGHTCAHGKEDYNMALGERRANAVREYLVKEGIASDRLSTISYGETRLAMPETPTAKNKNSKEAKENRRVHFEVIVK